MKEGKEEEGGKGGGLEGRFCMHDYQFNSWIPEHCRVISEYTKNH